MVEDQARSFKNHLLRERERSEYHSAFSVAVFSNTNPVAEMIQRPSNRLFSTRLQVEP